MIMSPLIAFLIVFVLLLIALIKLKVTPSVGLFAAAIIFGLMVGMPAADILSKLPAGFGNMMTSIGLLIVFGSIFGDFLGNSGATEELAKGMVRLFGKKNDYLALNLVGFILSIPIYFGCAYIMTAPLVTALQKISKKSMKGYVIAIFTGLMLTHSCVAPLLALWPSQARLARTSAGSSSGASSSACPPASSWAGCMRTSSTRRKKSSAPATR